MPFSQFTHQSFVLFEFYFRYVNWDLKTFEQADREYRVKSFQLVGLEGLWEIALSARDETVPLLSSPSGFFVLTPFSSMPSFPILQLLTRQVGGEAIEMILKLERSLAPALLIELNTHRAEFLDKCMSNLQKVSPSPSSHLPTLWSAPLSFPLPPFSSFTPSHDTVGSGASKQGSDGRRTISRRNQIESRYHRVGKVHQTL